MKFIVDKLPESPKECPFATNSTGKYRCGNTALLCPVARGGACPYIIEVKKTGKKKQDEPTGDET